LFLENNITVPTGALVNVSLLEQEFGELEEPGTIIYWYSLTRTTVPANVSFITRDSNSPVVTLFRADISQSGVYILCRRMGGIDICGGSVHVTVTGKSV